MYGSIRFFLDKTPFPINGQHLLNIFELFSSILGKEYDYYSYIIWSPDKDDYFIDKSYPNTSNGKESFMNECIIPIVKGKYGDLSAPVISATCKCKETQIYSGIRVEIRFPVGLMPFTICADFEEEIVNTVRFIDYLELINGLQSKGYLVNNGFYHIYSMRNEAATLDGGQIGSVVSRCGRKNIKQCIEHRKKGEIDRIMGIYFYNSIRNDLLNNKIRNRIFEIIGNKNVSISQNVLSFTLSSEDDASSTYWIKHCRTIRLLERELFQTGVNRDG